MRVMCKPGSEGGRGGQPPRSTRPDAPEIGLTPMPLTPMPLDPDAPDPDAPDPDAPEEVRHWLEVTYYPGK